MRDILSLIYTQEADVNGALLLTGRHYILLPTKTVGGVRVLRFCTTVHLMMLYICIKKKNHEKLL